MVTRRGIVLGLFVVALAAAAPAKGSTAAPDTPAPPTVLVPAGPFVAGSDRTEREAAYRLDEAAYGHTVTRDQGWYEREPARHTAEADPFHIMTRPVTNTDYAAFLAATDHPWPDVDRQTWAGYGLIHPFERTRRHAWSGPSPPAGREDHPVVMVSHADALAYAAWLTGRTGLDWRLPSAEEWEKAVRGIDGRLFPWGAAFDPDRLNSHDRGPFDTMPVGSFPDGASPFGVLDGAGQVYEWTATAGTPGRHVVKGGSWDDKGCGVCRPAARHTRPDDLKHILVGFRLVHDIADAPE